MRRRWLFLYKNRYSTKRFMRMAITTKISTRVMIDSSVSLLPIKNMSDFLQILEKEAKSIF